MNDLKKTELTFSDKIIYSNIVFDSDNSIKSQTFINCKNIV